MFSKMSAKLESAEEDLGKAAKALEEVNEANLLVERTRLLALNCILNRVPFAIENPYHSLMWMVPGMKHIISLPGVTCTRVDFCQYGESTIRRRNL